MLCSLFHSFVFGVSIQVRSCCSTVIKPAEAGTYCIYAYTYELIEIIHHRRGHLNLQCIRQIYSISIILIAIKIIIIINIIIIIIFTIIIAINNRLAPEMVEDLVTLKCNLHLLREQPSV